MRNAAPASNKSLKKEMKAIKSHQCQFGIPPKAKTGTVALSLMAGMQVWCEDYYYFKQSTNKNT